jgi:hypothetical protein
MVCWGRRSLLIGEGDRVDAGGKRESRRAETAPCEDWLSEKKKTRKKESQKERKPERKKGRGLPGLGCNGSSAETRSGAAVGEHRGRTMA